MKTVAMYQNKMAWCCVLCGEHIGKAYGRAVLVDDDGDGQGLLCERCIEAGPVGAADRARAYAGGLRDCADHLDTLASEVAQITEWATLDDVTAIDAQIDMDRLEAANTCEQCGAELIVEQVETDSGTVELACCPNCDVFSVGPDDKVLELPQDS